MAQGQGIEHEPSFKWWIPHVLKKRDRIVAIVMQQKTRYQKWIHNWKKTVKLMLAMDTK